MEFAFVFLKSSYSGMPESEQLYPMKIISSLLEALWKEQRGKKSDDPCAMKNLGIPVDTLSSALSAAVTSENLGAMGKQCHCF